MSPRSRKSFTMLRIVHIAVLAGLALVVFATCAVTAFGTLDVLGGPHPSLRTGVPAVELPALGR